MKMSQLIYHIATYDALLVRYARIITKSEDASRQIALSVFEELFDTSTPLSEPALRHWLKSRTVRKSKAWLRFSQLNFSSGKHFSNS